MSRNNEDYAMTNKMALTVFTAGLFIASVLFAACVPSAAQERFAISTEFSAQQQQQDKNKTNQAPRTGPVRVTPRITTQPHVVAPRQTIPRTITQPKVTPRVVGPRVGPKLVAPSGTGPKVVSPAIKPRVITPRGTRTITAARLRGVPARGAGPAVIRGHNYSAWRNGYRVRHGNRWRTFVALSALGAIAIGAIEYYPYAYISAPEPYCEGLTEDGCELMWQEVETLEGDVINQCVAYCPWQ